MKNAENKRQLSIAQDIKKALAAMFLRNEFFELEAFKGMVTVTEVHLNANLRVATCYISFFTPTQTQEDAKIFFQCLKNLKGSIRRLIAKEVPMKFIPEIIFKPDATYERAQRICTLIDREISRP